LSQAGSWALPTAHWTSDDTESGRWAGPEAREKSQVSTVVRMNEVYETQSKEWKTLRTALWGEDGGSQGPTNASTCDTTEWLNGIGKSSNET